MFPITKGQHGGKRLGNQQGVIGDLLWVVQKQVWVAVLRAVTNRERTYFGTHRDLRFYW